MTAAGHPSGSSDLALPHGAPASPASALLPPPPRAGAVTLVSLSYQVAYLLQEQALQRADQIQGHQLVASALDRFADRFAERLAPALARELAILLAPPPPPEAPN